MKILLSDPFFEAQFLNEIKGDRSCKLGCDLKSAQGMFMYCPCAYQKAHRAHGIFIPFDGRNVPANFGPVDDSGNRPRWKIKSGSSLADLTLEPSVLVGTARDACWHGHITNGVVT